MRRIVLIGLTLALAGCASYTWPRQSPNLALRPHETLFASLIDPSFPQVGEVVSTTNGTWTNAPTSFAYKWRRCNTVGACFDIPGAASSSYVLTANDVGYRIESIVTASNQYGSASQTSALTGTVNNLGSQLPAALASPAPLRTLTGSSTQSLATLFSGLQAGDQLCLHTGTYGSGQTTAVTVTGSGTAANPITIQSCAGETATIAQMVKVQGSYIRLHGLKIVANSYPTNPGRAPTCPGSHATVGNVGIWMQGSHDTIENSEISGAVMSGIFSDSTAAYNQILANFIHDNGTSSDDHGIYWAGPNVLIANNLVTNNYAFGVQIGYSSATNGIVTNNTLVSNGIGSTCLGSGVVTFSGTASNAFYNNIAYNNRDVGFKTYDTQNSLFNDEAFGNPNGSTFGTWLGSAVLSANPLFVSSTDFHLQASSPARSAGNPAYTPPTDYYGVHRITADLGAVAGQ